MKRFLLLTITVLLVLGIFASCEYEKECNHSWELVTVPATCSSDGYDMEKCALCGDTIITNKTAPIDHTYTTTYTFDEAYHWFTCESCDLPSKKENHTLDENGICLVCMNPILDTPGAIYTLSKDGTYACVNVFHGNASKVKFASEYKGVPVKKIISFIFGNANMGHLTRITDVILPESIEIIDMYAFHGCTALTSIVIPDSVTTIGQSAFQGCTSLKSVLIGNGVKEINYQAFRDCSSLTSVIMGESVSSIATYAFLHCSSLESIVIPDSVTSLGSYSFVDCTSLRHVKIGSGVDSIGEDAFHGCSSLASLEISEGVTHIGQGAFVGCSSLTSVEIPSSVTTIDMFAFLSCTSLETVFLPKSVTNIEDYAFYKCGAITDVYYAGTSEEWQLISIGEGNSFLTEATIHFNYHPEE